MSSCLYETFSEICGKCSLDGSCCKGAMPPLTSERVEILQRAGVAMDAIDQSRYKKLKLKSDGFCVLFEKGGCTVHDVKPETCIAGPFTFDMKGDVLEIYLKKETICPLAGFLYRNNEAFDVQYDQAVERIVHLIKLLPKDELTEILKIEEPDTFKVSETSYRKELGR